MRRVLVVEDDPGTRASFSQFLSIHGFAVTTACTAAEALRHLLRTAFISVIADLRLPDYSGVQLLRNARANRIDVPFTIMSGFATIQATVDAMNAGAVTVLEKPVDMDSMIRLLELQSQSSHDAISMASHARWADLIVRLIDAAHDPRTTTDWALTTGHSKATIANRCRAVQVSVKRSLDLARMLRAISVSNRLKVPIDSLLDADPRTLTRLKCEAGVSDSASGSAEVDARTFLRQQVFTRDELAIAGVEKALSELSGCRDTSEG